MFLPWPAGDREQAQVEPEPETDVVKITTVESPDPALPGATEVVSPAPSAAAPAPPLPAASWTNIAPPEDLSAPRPARPSASTAERPTNRPTSAGSQSQGEVTGGQTVADFFAAFPRYPGAQPGSAAILRPEFDQARYLFNTVAGLDAIATEFQTNQLPNSGFTWQPHAQEPDFRVYQVQRDTGEIGYLHLIRQDDRTALYLEADAYTLAQLREARTEPMDSDRKREFATDIAMAMYAVGQTPANINDEQQWANKLVAPDTFKTSNGSLDKQRFEFFYATDLTDSLAAVGAQLQDALSSNPEKNYQFEALGELDGGNTLYAVQRDDSQIFIILAPAEDGRKVVIISTDSDPRSS